MDTRIDKFQQRFFNKLFATLPSVRKNNEFNNESNFNYFYYNKNKDFWFSKLENEDKYIFLFGIRDKPIRHIGGDDVCLIIDFNKNIQFNDNCLGLFSVKNDELYILINHNILKERYPYINTSDFKISNFKSIDNSFDLEVINLGNLNNELIDNIEKLVISVSKIKSSKKAISKNIIDSDECHICSVKKSNFKINPDLNSLKNLKPELCGFCIEKIFVSEFYTKIIPLLKENRTDELKVAKEKYGNDQIFDIGLKLLEKYKIIQYVGIKKLFYTIDRDSYLVKKYIKYSDENNLLIDQIPKIKGYKSKYDLDGKQQDKKTIENNKIEEYKSKEINRKIFLENFKSGKTKGESAKKADVELSLIDEWYSKGSKNKKPFVEFYDKYLEIEKNKEPQIPRLTKTGAFGNQKSISAMNSILEDLANGKSEDEAIEHTNISKNTYEYWINRGKQEFGELYVQFYKYVMEFKSKPVESSEINGGKSEENEKNWSAGIYEPLLKEYEDSFISMNNTGIAWVNKTGSKWTYSRNINGKTISLSAHTIPELYEQVISQDLIWGIRDYDRAKEFIDFPDDFVIPKMEIEEVFDKSDLDIYAPLSDEYEKSFSSMNQTGIAWVNKIGSKFYYVKSNRGKSIRLSGENIYDLFKNVKNAKQIWGIRDYDKAKEFIDFPDDFEFPSKSQVEESVVDIEVDPDIYAPLSEEYEMSFSSMNQTGISWVNRIGKRWIYSRKDNGKTIKFDDENIYLLHKKVKDAKQIWGIRDYDRAKEFIDFPDDFEFPSKSQVEESVVDIEVDPDIYAPLSEEYEMSFSSMNQTGIAWVNKIGSKFYYVKSNRGKNIRLSGENIYLLHKKVKDAKQIWGIRDYSKAKQHINIPDDYEIPKKEEEIVINTEIDESIYDPLSPDQLSKFNPNPNNKSGIAWVNKVGNKWVYQRQRNGKTIRIYDSNIINLHEKVIKNNQIWGITDIDKARKAIETNSIDDKRPSKPQKSTKSIINKSDVTVTYIEKSMNNFEILIKGTIKNKDLFDVLLRFGLFKENIKRIITNSIGNESDIFIELEINKYLLHTFEGKIKDLGWEIIR